MVGVCTDKATAGGSLVLGSLGGWSLGGGVVDGGGSLK